MELLTLASLFLGFSYGKSRRQLHFDNTVEVISARSRAQKSVDSAMVEV